MADLITRLLLNTQQFDNNLGKSTKQIQGFQQKIQSISSASISAFTKFAGTVGIAITAGEALNKMMRSNQTTSDLFDNNLNAAKGSVDAFFKSLTTGDWSVFNNGLLGTYNNLKDLSALMDELADKKLSLSYIRADDLKDIERFEQIAKDTNRTLEERKDAAQNMSGVVTHLAKATRETIDLELKKLNTDYAARSGLKIDTDDIGYFVSHTNFNGTSTTNAQNAYKEYVRLNREAEKLKKSALYEAKRIGYNPTEGAQKKYEEKRKELELYKKENDFIIKQGWLAEEADDKRRETVQTLIEQMNIEREIYSIRKRADETGRSVRPSTTSSKKEIIPGGSIAEMRKIIADLTKQYENAADEGTRAGLFKAIQAAKTELKMTELRAAGTSLMNGGKFSKTAGRNVADDVKSGYINIKPISTDSIKANYDYADSLGAIASVMSSVTNITNEGAAGWLAYGANIFSSISAAIPMITSLTTALTAKAAAEAAGSAAAVPVVGWVNAVAAITAIMSAMSTIPKFADGGIISGNSFIGDNMIARVNSGEMILNNRQQKNLFNLLDGRTSVNAGSEVKLRIEGRDLVGVLNSQTNRTSKYK